MLFGVCAFVADLGNVIVVQSTMTTAADAAALAGAGALSQSYTTSEARAVAIEYAQANVPDNYGTVADDLAISFGDWDPQTQEFTADEADPNAIRVVVQRTAGRNNPVPYFFGSLFGKDEGEVSREAIAVGAVNTYAAQVDQSVYVTSTKDLSNVVLEFADGEHQKFEGISGYAKTFAGTGEHLGKEVVGVWIKSGCNSSGDGPGYGEYLPNTDDGSTQHGQPARGCTPHVTATFESSGAEFTESGSASPVRLVR